MSATRLVVVITLQFLSALCAGQTGKIDFGIQASAGGNLTENHFQTGHNYHAAYGAGGFLSVTLPAAFSLQISPSYNRRNSFYAYTDTSSLLDNLEMLGMENADSTFGFAEGILNFDVISRTRGRSYHHYIDVPIMLYWTWQEKLRIGVGGYGGLLIGTRNKQVLEQDIPLFEATSLEDSIQELRFFLQPLYPGYYKPQEKDFNSTRDYLKVDGGLSAEVGLLVHSAICLGLRYDHGLTQRRSDDFALFNRTRMVRLTLSWSVSQFFENHPKRPIITS